MWILTAASKEEKAAVAEYFRTPLVVAMAGGDKASASTSAIPGGGPDPMFSEGERARVHVREQSRPSEEQKRFFMDLQRRIEATLAADPSLRELRSQLRFDLTLEGLRIMVMDNEKRPMFTIGSDEVAPYMRELLRTIAPMLNELPNELSISGHTDSLPYAGGIGGYSNWELSSARALASRRELVAGGLDPGKLLRVSGVADNVLVAGTFAESSINRRIELLLLYPETAEAIRVPALLNEAVKLAQSGGSTENTPGLAFTQSQTGSAYPEGEF
jgi:chemotaxis protein MotB